MYFETDDQGHSALSAARLNGAPQTIEADA